MKKQNAKINIHREPRKRHTVKRKKPLQRRHIKNNQSSIRRILQEGNKTMTETTENDKKLLSPIEACILNQARRRPRTADREPEAM
jgi:hypothetical protein